MTSFNVSSPLHALMSSGLFKDPLTLSLSLFLQSDIPLSLYNFSRGVNELSHTMKSAAFSRSGSPTIGASRSIVCNSIFFLSSSFFFLSVKSPMQVTMSCPAWRSQFVANSSTYESFILIFTLNFAFGVTFLSSLRRFSHSKIFSLRNCNSVSFILVNSNGPLYTRFKTLSISSLIFITLLLA